MVWDPAVIDDPGSVQVAVTTPPDPERAEQVSGVDPSVTVTVPVGSAVVAFWAVTVTV
jgi:hypothetical protein